MVDDSDVFSIIVSQANPSEVFASACREFIKALVVATFSTRSKAFPSARAVRAC